MTSHKRPDCSMHSKQCTTFSFLKEMRGKENVLTEVYLHFSVYNLLRAMTQYNSNVLIAKLKELGLYFLTQKELFKKLLRVANYSLCSESFSRILILDSA